MANEKRLVDANALCDRITATFPAMSANAMYVAIEKAPTVDAVEVVRCKDCKYGEYDYTEYFDYYECRYIGGDWNKGDHFCSYGERKDNEN